MSVNEVFLFSEPTTTERSSATCVPERSISLHTAQSGSARRPTVAPFEIATVGEEVTQDALPEGGDLRRAAPAGRSIGTSISRFITPPSIDTTRSVLSITASASRVSQPLPFGQRISKGAGYGPRYSGVPAAQLQFEASVISPVPR